VDVSGAIELRCAACQAPLAPEDRFCEQCGARFVAKQLERGACRVCGAPDAIDADGYCSVCGARERAAEDRVELDLAVAAAVSDRGRVHHRNEDSFALELIGEGRVAAVVCDGISSSSAGGAAARSAAGAAGAVLAKGLSGVGEDTGARDTVLAAVGAARGAVSEVQWTTRADRAMPSCTLVCALWREQEIVFASVGDSRAYWIGADGPRQLTVDDSWAEEQVAAGNLTSAQAMADRRAHSITNWIGPDAPDREPRVEILRPDEPGRLLLCSDGLWNYVPDSAALGELINALPDGASAAAVARALTDTAVDRGGRDNITVVVVDVQPRSGARDGRVHG
jgi:serine/threonine protein phosphatase PrpC